MKAALLCLAPPSPVWSQRPGSGRQTRTARPALPARSSSRKMLWFVVTLLATALSVESYNSHERERLAHGRQLKIYLSKNAETLEFTPADDHSQTFTYWKKGQFRTRKGRVSGSGSDQRWYIDKVTYEDEGTYIQRDFWKKDISNIKVGVTPRRNYLKRVAGETLSVSLEGINQADSTLTFSGPTGNFTLVNAGARVSQDLSEYWDRVEISSTNIEIRNVNYSDEGHYYLKDRKDRLVSVTRMDLTDHHEDSGGNPLLALLLLLGIPAGICCCCRKKIFKNKASTSGTLQTLPVTVQAPPSGPVGPSPPYSAPGQPAYYHGPNPSSAPTIHPPPMAPGPGQWNGPPPSPGFNPVYPPAGPAITPPVHPPQWNGPPPGLNPYGPPDQAGYAPAPVMYSSPPPPAAGEPGKGQEVKMENLASSPADPLLAATPQAGAAASLVAPVPPSSTNPLSSSHDAHQFQIDGGNNSSNFL
ncbi:uncharacterized protein LOC115047428 [Echeneis naucrates]|uniref:Uncharacterized LOC115047428 n=1 Tax=Echeneis naucrates TaxID=173247 RepID=A0A665URQ2_ECHNA|nr:uncharacterized protein LOC115047428 [Echeneis naucrates]XP_029364220.1 uncharacterized protein LOC115047428 [Echeneis naucrates]